MDPALAAAFTGELRLFVAAAGTRRSLPSTCHVGRPGGEQVALAGPTDLADQGLRTDLVERALDGLTEPQGACVWVTRGGELGPTDLDLGWYAAARHGFARHGVGLNALVVMTRTGWGDLVSGEQRVWRRLRHRHPAA